MSLNIIVGGVRYLHPIAKDFYYGIGYKNGLPWGRIKEDMDVFKQMTSGTYSDKYYSFLNEPYESCVVMGRKTWESIPKRFLKDRHNIVLSRKPIIASNPNIEHYTSLNDELLNHLQSTYKHTWIIGGESIYNYVLEHYASKVKHVVLNEIVLKRSYEFDTFFPSMEKYKEQFTCKYIKPIPVKSNENISHLNLRIFTNHSSS